MQQSAWLFLRSESGWAISDSQTGIRLENMGKPSDLARACAAGLEDAWRWWSNNSAGPPGIASTTGAVVKMGTWERGAWKGRSKAGACFGAGARGVDRQGRRTFFPTSKHAGPPSTRAYAFPSSATPTAGAPSRCRSGHQASSQALTKELFRSFPAFPHQATTRTIAPQSSALTGLHRDRT